MSVRGDETKDQILTTTQDLVLERGFAGTSIDDILNATGLSKGAFFYHFKNKAELGLALIERYAEHDLAIFEQLTKRADELSSDPLQSTLIFLKLFEEFLVSLNGFHPGCLFASYVYESANFDQTTSASVTAGFEDWKKIYTDRFKKVVAQHRPKQPVRPEDLAELIMSIIQGSFILSKSLSDPALVARNVGYFRRHLELLFCD